MCSALITSFCFLFFFNDTATTEIYTLSLHDALPIYRIRAIAQAERIGCSRTRRNEVRSEEHTSELQSLTNLVCRLLLEKNKRQYLKELVRRIISFCSVMSRGEKVN